jgi:Protein of unknown function (DUF3500)
MTRFRPALFLVAVVIARLFSASAPAHTPAEEMSFAAKNFVAALTPDQRAKAVIEFKSDERFNWHYIPRERKGLPFKEMSAPQRQLAHGILLSALSVQGYTKTTNIISTVEQALRELENQSTRRDSGLYYLTVFGDPAAAESTWGWRIEGHHLSLNFVISAGHVVAVTPSFMGANPATVPAGPNKGFRALAAEEDLGRQLVKSLNEEQRKVAVITNVAPGDIVTASLRKVRPLEPTGLGADRLSASQKEMLLALIKEYLFRCRSEIAEDDLKKIQAAGFDKIHFAWAGGFEHGEKHYYRVQGPTILLEYDNTQNDANHIHSVWRDFENDFGEDALRRHYEQNPHTR